MNFGSFDESGNAIIFGSSGGIGQALVSELKKSNHFNNVIGFSRGVGFDLEREESIQKSISSIEKQNDIRLAIDATGFLHSEYQLPEKNLKNLNSKNLLYSFIVNAIGPSLIMKHLFPILPRSGKCVFATLSARVGSIGDNHSGGWYAYRSSKAALNQLVKTAALELARTRPNGICVAIHPGTVSTSLSEPFTNKNWPTVSPEEASNNILNVIKALKVSHNGGFFDWSGKEIPW